MSSTNGGNKIITLPSRSPPQFFDADRLNEPLKSIREIALKRFAQLVSALFDNVDDALFDRAGQAQSGILQTEYFDGMRNVRLKRQRVERMMLDRVGQVFADFVMNRIQAPRTELTPAAATGGLSLVEDQDLEEVLAVASMISKSESRLATPLYAINQRLSAIRGGTPVESGTNPIGPAQLCDAFSAGMAEFELNVQMRLIIYKLFDRYVLLGLDAFYDEVNAHLIRAGVLPQLRHHSNASSPSAPLASRVAPSPNMREEVGADAGIDSAQPSPIETEIYQTLRSLLALRHAESPHTFASAPSQPSLAPIDLLSALQILQGQTLRAPGRGAEFAPNALDLKQALIEQAGNLQAGNSAGVASVDEDTIDLVGMLFEFIVQDRNLPSQMQALLGRLQIPFLKVAILDRHLFTQKTHPARQLLDNMAQACVGKTADDDQELFEKIRQIVESILQEFEDDLGPIERANTEFNRYIGTAKKRAELAEKRTAETVQGREKLERARRLAANEMSSRCADANLPALVERLLNGPLAQYLVLIALRQGEDSSDWKQTLSFADALIWSIAPKNNDAERTRLKNLQPALFKYLRQSLGKVAWREEDIETVVQELNQLFVGRPEPAPISTLALHQPATAQFAHQSVHPVNAADSASIDVLLGMMEKSSLHNEPEPVETVEPIDVDADHLEQIRSMKVGTWVEFSHLDTGMKERAKLSWISPISSKFLFVDRKGVKVTDMTPPELAAELAAGRLTLIEDSLPLFDRALSAVVERLKSFQPPVD